MSKTKIAWATDVWNPVVGCTPVSEGCRNCYAKRLHDMRHKAYLEGKHLPVQYAQPFEKVQGLESRLNDPLHWREPRRVFVNSMSDLFHDDVPDGFIFGAFMRMAKAEQHTFMILTKRPKRMQKWIVNNWMTDIFGDYHPELALPNVHLGVSITSDKDLWMVEELSKTPAAVRFVSYEPALGPLALNLYLYPAECTYHDFVPLYRKSADGRWRCPVCGDGSSKIVPLDWVICGGETGPNARPMHPDWARSLRDQCVASSVPFFYKQQGAWELTDERLEIQRLANGEKERELASIKVPGAMMYQEAWFRRIGSKAAGHLLDGVEWHQFPTAESAK